MALHLPPVFRYPEAIVFWLVYLWAFYAEMLLIRKSAPESNREQDKGTMRRVLVASQTGLLIAFAVSPFPFLTLPYPRIALTAGTLMLLLGGVLRRACFRALGRHFTGAVTVTEDQPVVDTGPYRLVRHPSYAAGLMLFFGIGLGLGSLASIAALLGLSGWAYSHRIRAEEAALLETIGEPYRAYMARTKRLIPFVF